MRVAWETRFRLAQTAIERSQQQLTRLQQQLATGKRLISLAEDPVAFGRARRLEEALQLVERQQALLHGMVEEVRSAQSQVEELVAAVQDMEALLAAALDPKNLDKPALLAEQLRQRLEDVLRSANADFDGRYLFAGTATVLPGGERPFELRRGAPTPENPSGLEILFRGNLAERRVMLAPGQEEVLSLRADELFGAGGTELFTVLIAAYNLLAYRADGSQRPPEESLSAAERTQVQALLPQLAALREMLERAIARIGSRQARWELLAEHLQAYTVQLREFLSEAEDADIARLALELQNAQTTYHAVLQTSSRILTMSLFDFLR
ncbi:Flagellar hook-associated protein 3 [bacterium HR21]|jgi:flagellar hook-associated protein 3 FlgL|nr:Flagellar hook-associated protein 3 [bacterium HR21]